MTDLLVVGGGPGGLATAIRARLAGLDARVVDRARPPIDKACGEGLMPDAVARLREIGVEPRGLPLRGIRYVDGDLAAEGHFPGFGGLGVRRTELHAGLVRRAEETGVDLRWGVKAEGLTAEGIQTDQGTFAARWIVGADGLRSQVRTWAGLDGGPSPLRRFGVRRHFAVTPWSDCVEVHWGPACEAYVTPVAGAAVTSRDRGTGPLQQRVRAVSRGQVALVGDAAGYLDAITGEGLAVTLHESAALVAALVAGDLAPYAAAHRRINRLPNFMTSLVLALERRPRLRRRALRALAAEPALFARLLGIHARTLPPRGLGFEGALRLAGRMMNGG